MLGMLKYSEWQWEEAEQHMRKAVALDPENDDSVTWLANLLRGQARWQECIEIYQQARTINPINWVQTQQLGEVLWHAGRHLEALGMLAEASRLNPGNATSHRLRAEVYDTMGDEREALAARKVAAQLNRDREYIETVLSEVPRGYRAVREAELQFSQRRHDLWGVAIGLTYLGRHEDALSALDQCITEKCGMSILIATEPRLKALHQFSRFRELAARVNLGHLVAN
jgi:tetratricopeptide (TPR) repeat protein